MRINMPWWLITVASVVLVECNSGIAENDLYGSGFIVVNEQTWDENYKTPYPFTVPEGEISCSSHTAFGREVYFDPKGYTDESYIGIPLNKSAVDSLEQSNMNANVPNSVKEGADLSDAIQVGLKVCDEQEDMIKNG